ncbi:hypothetical protein COT30_01115 [Candidatus Micrarchaeota archaeon CG08_land_8_20_14_0_20_49_17]|nr:MAG: hypothetical protein AUJ13_00500 [Candidatus Micrarchaeota archaeon CG1_02_49_24]PIU10071.1 MAG: hypothetical protein COT30_01115 [Candidatus Micrarchaeota archaeon CG08_land_8_20_14_0_20_49_17]HII53533.1 hypothetical protein [Candidatus Micrarchaeota archaeon]
MADTKQVPKPAAPTAMEANFKLLLANYNRLTSEQQLAVRQILYTAAVDAMTRLNLPKGVGSPQDMVVQLVRAFPFRNKVGNGTPELTVEQYAFVNNEAYRMGLKQGKKLDPVATANEVVMAMNNAGGDTSKNPVAIVGAYLTIVARNKNDMKLTELVNKFKGVDSKPTLSQKVELSPIDATSLAVEVPPPTTEELLNAALAAPAPKQTEMKNRDALEPGMEDKLARAREEQPSAEKPAGEEANPVQAPSQLLSAEKAVIAAQQALTAPITGFMASLDKLTQASKERLVSRLGLQDWGIFKQTLASLTDPAAFSSEQANVFLKALEAAITELETTQGKRKGGFLGGLVNRLPGVRVGTRGGISEDDKAALTEARVQLTTLTTQLNNVQAAQAALWTARSDQVNDFLERLPAAGDKIFITVKKDASGAFSSVTLTGKHAGTTVGPVSIGGVYSEHFFGVLISVLDANYTKNSETKYTVKSAQGQAA